jgi:hypothetical protein
MVRVCGTPYIERESTCPAPQNTCSATPTCAPTCTPPPCGPNRVIRTGPSYIESPWRPSFFQPCAPYVPSPVITHSYSAPVDPSCEAAAAVIAVVAIAAIVAIGAAIAISQDCHVVGKECGPYNLFGERVCNLIYDCAR